MSHVTDDVISCFFIVHDNGVDDVIGRVCVCVCVCLKILWPDLVEIFRVNKLGAWDKND